MQRRGRLTSGLACRASTRSWEKRTGVSLWWLLLGWGYGAIGGRGEENYLVKTCWVLEGGGFEVP